MLTMHQNYYQSSQQLAGHTNNLNAMSAFDQDASYQHHQSCLHYHNQQQIQNTQHMNNNHQEQVAYGQQIYSNQQQDDSLNSYISQLQYQSFMQKNNIHQQRTKYSCYLENGQNQYQPSKNLLNLQTNQFLSNQNNYEQNQRGINTNSSTQGSFFMNFEQKSDSLSNVKEFIPELSQSFKSSRNSNMNQELHLNALQTPSFNKQRSVFALNKSNNSSEQKSFNTNCSFNKPNSGRQSPNNFGVSDFNSDISTQISDQEAFNCLEEFPTSTLKRQKKQHKTKQDYQNFVKGYTMKKKTEMCKNWVDFGKCKYGSECSFAHGEHELRKKQHLNDKFKTDSCYQFHTLGYCTYGSRCQFLHSQFDLKSINNISAPQKNSEQTAFEHNNCNHESHSCSHFHDHSEYDNNQSGSANLSYKNIVYENVRLSEGRVKMMQQGQECLTYVNVFKTKRLSIFDQIVPQQQ